LTNLFCEILGSCRKVIEASLCWEIAQLRLVVFSDVSGKTLCPVFDGQAVQEGHSSWNDLRFNVGQIGCPENSVKSYQHKLRDIPEEQRLPRESDQPSMAEERFQKIAEPAVLSLRSLLHRSLDRYRSKRSFRNSRRLKTIIHKNESFCRLLIRLLLGHRSTYFTKKNLETSSKF